MISEEIDIISRFPAPTPAGQSQSSAQQQQLPPPPQRQPNRLPPNMSIQPPLIITREKIRAAVFGAGYPSVPTMTLDQFVDLQVSSHIFVPCIHPLRSCQRASR